MPPEIHLDLSDPARASEAFVKLPAKLRTDALALTADGDLTTLSAALAASGKALLASAATPSDDLIEQAARFVEGRDEIRKEQQRRIDAADDRRHRADALIAAADDPSPLPADAPPLKARIARVNATRPGAMTTRPSGSQRSALVASTGQELRSADDLVAELGRHQRDTWVGKRTLFSARRPASPFGTLGENPSNNDAVIASALAQADTMLEQALTASGGLCFTPNSRYEQDVWASPVRPVRAALVPFDAGRGGIRLTRPPLLTTVDDGVVVWTEANDTNPADPATKPVYTMMTCPDVVEVLVDAIAARIQGGNFNQRFWPEQLTAVLALIEAAHARVAELNLTSTIAAGSTAITTTEGLGAARDLLAVMDRASFALRDRLRLDPTATLQVILPQWVKWAIVTDLVREHPGASVERLAMTEQQVNAFFTSRRIAVTWSLDYEAATTTQFPGLLRGWPDTATALMFPAGSWLFVDGGRFDVGLVRSETLNATNDFEWFFESFEEAAFVGVESLAITMDLCPSGYTASGLSATDWDPCTVGS
jgi:hypothetical protein